MTIKHGQERMLKKEEISERSRLPNNNGKKETNNGTTKESEEERKRLTRSWRGNREALQNRKKGDNLIPEAARNTLNGGIGSRCRGRGLERGRGPSTRVPLKPCLPAFISRRLDPFITV